MATLLVMGFTQTPTIRSEWRGKKTEAQIRAGCLQQWDILEIHPDRTPMGRLGGRQSRDAYHRNAGHGRWLFFRVHVPSIEYGIKNIVETPLQRWPEWYRVGEPYRMDGHLDDAVKPLDEVRSAYCIDFNSLPEWAKISLMSIGEVTLNEQDARSVIKHKASLDQVVRLFNEASA